MDADLAAADVDQILARAIVEEVVVALAALEEVFSTQAHGKVICGAAVQLVAKGASHQLVASRTAEELVGNLGANGGVVAGAEIGLEELERGGIDVLDGAGRPGVVAGPEVGSHLMDCRVWAADDGRIHTETGHLNRIRDPGGDVADHQIE